MEHNNVDQIADIFAKAFENEKSFNLETLLNLGSEMLWGQVCRRV